ncbi:hypothetical protein CR152_18565 [Massilia violaceinigra]|uniref:Uncharacterized protein n=1 Tax=Massilia violaceinigra TaxID=2045208 RepID=A0A2D2DMU8_9BURK|nr:hypothetical protein [Massilia violaceinigra]ATQ76309.1 hypothetical protein CR152_18565 [Massilia violaceinigra]
MSSLYEKCGTFTPDPEHPSAEDALPGNDQDALTGSEPGTSSKLSYSTHFHLNYVTAFGEKGKSVEGKNVLRFTWSSSAGAGVNLCVPLAHTSVSCNIDVKGESEQLRLDVDTSASEAGLGSPSSVNHPPNEQESGEEALKSARARRTAALNSMFGMWKDRGDTPKDGLQFQKEMREEWR